MSALRVYSRKRARNSVGVTDDDHNHYNRVVKKSKTDALNRRGTSIQYMRQIHEKLSSEMAEIEAKIDQVCSDVEENGQRLLNAFQGRSIDYENKLKNESEKLNKLYQELCNYKTSHDELYGDEFRKFQAEKEKFMAWLLESRNMEKDKLGAIDDQIKRVKYCIERRNKVYADVMAFVKWEVADLEDEMRHDPTTTTS